MSNQSLNSNWWVRNMNIALVIIDVQDAFNDPKWGERNNLDAEKNIKLLLNNWRKSGLEVVFIQHISQDSKSIFHPNQATSRIKRLIQPKQNETVFTKEVNSAFIGTPLEDHLKNLGIQDIVITGLTTPHCVSTTTRMSANLGFTTYLISDAVAAFGLTDQHGRYIDAKTVHDLSVATLHEEFATILSTEECIEKLLNV